MKIDCGMTFHSNGAIYENIRHLNKLKKLNLGSNDQNKIGNSIGDGGCHAIFLNAMFLTNLLQLNLDCIKVRLNRL